jgi:hypothetical protein
MAERRLACPQCGEPIVVTDHQCMACGVALDEGELVGSATGQRAPAAPVGAAAVVAAGPVAPGPAVPYRVHPLHQQTYAGGGTSLTQGLWASLQRALEFIRQSLALAGEYPVLLAPSLVSVVVGLVIVGIFLGVTFVLSGGRMPEQGQEGPLVQVAGVVTGLVAMLVNFWCMGMTADLVSAALRGQRPDLGHAWREACKNGLALLWLAVITTAVNAFSRQGRGRGGILTAVASQAIQATWRVASYLLVPIIILEDIPLSRAFNRAIDLHKTQVIGIIVGEVGLRLFTRIVGTVVFLLAVAGLVVGVVTAPLLLPLLIAGLVGLIVLLAAAGGYLHMAYYTCLYEWAVALETAAEPLPAPAPLALALDRA